jgi:predicted nucleic acid-binding protein
MLVVADTSPLNYLILIQAIQWLPLLYRRIAIPPAVWSELSHQDAPRMVLDWVAAVPPWLEIITPILRIPNLDLDEGESAAIALALELKANRLLLDERQGRKLIANRFPIEVAGTLAVLTDAAIAGHLDLRQALAALRTTNFRASARLYDEVLAQYELKRTISS